MTSDSCAKDSGVVTTNHSQFGHDTVKVASVAVAHVKVTAAKWRLQSSAYKMAPGKEYVARRAFFPRHFIGN